MINQEEYRDYCKRFRIVEKFLAEKSAPSDVVIYNICQLRKYCPGRMEDTLKKIGFYFIEGNQSIYNPLRDAGDDLGLFSQKSGNFRLAGRFIFPVKDMLGNTIALIGWFPDSKKYITTPSKLFSKSGMFFGMEQLLQTGIRSDYWLCEGIFDTIALRSVGKFAIAQMGIASSKIKEAYYSLFSKLYAVPDGDEEGREVINGDLWNLPVNSKYLKIVSNKFKDIDDVINKHDKDDIIDALDEIENSNERIYSLKL